MFADHFACLDKAKQAVVMTNKARGIVYRVAV